MLLVLVAFYFGRQLDEYKAQNERKANIDLKREERKQEEVAERAQRDRERSQMEDASRPKWSAATRSWRQ